MEKNSVWNELMINEKQLFGDAVLLEGVFWIDLNLAGLEQKLNNNLCWTDCADFFNSCYCVYCFFIVVGIQ